MFRRKAEPSPLEQFLHHLDARIPLDLSALSSSQTQSHDPERAAADLASHLHAVFNAQAQRITALQQRLLRCEERSTNYYRALENCRNQPLRTQLEETCTILTETEDALQDCQRELARTRQAAASLKGEIERLEAQIVEQQTLIARQQMRLLEIDADTP